MDHIDDLAKKAIHGDHDAFAVLFARFRPRVAAYCTRLLNSAADGEQAAQDVFVQVWRCRESYRSESPYEHWVMSIATRICLNLVRTKRDKDAALGLTLNNPDILAVAEARAPQTSMDSTIIQKVFAQQLLIKIRHRASTAKPLWDNLDWDIFHLIYEDGVETAREVARLLRESENTVKYRIYHHINVVLIAVGNEVRHEEDNI